METFLPTLDGTFWRHMVLALFHTLWIGALASGALFFLLRRIPARQSTLRYVAALGALAIIVLGGLLALAILESSPRPSARQPQAAAAFAKPAIQSQASDPAPKPPVTTAGATRQTPPARPSQAIPLQLTQILDRCTPWLAWVWLLGAALMLVRMAHAIAGAERAGRACRPLADPAALTLFAELKTLLGITRRVAARVGEDGAFPCVIGILRPAVLLPASLFTGVPPEHLRAILAHELAHVRRHDTLVNLAQMLIEALLFFNPFVWWISRQVRHEREACCDALAAAVIGRKTDYARALADFSRRRAALPSPADLAAPAFSDAPRPAGALDRIRRLLQPGYRPALRLPWPSFLMFLLISLLALACIKKASDGTVALAVKILSPRERIEKMAELEKTYGNGANRSYGLQDQITLSGRLVSEDGKPISGKGVSVSINSERPGYSIGMATSTKPDGTFSYKIEYGTIHLGIHAPGYAYLWAGPFKAPPGGKIENVRLGLKRAFKAGIRIVDPQGRPIPNTTLTGYYNTPGSSHSYLWYGNSALHTDARGVVAMDNLTTIPILLTGVAPGFEETQWTNIQVSPASTTTLTMKPTPPTEGVITSAADGYPVPGAKLRLVHQAGGLDNSWSPESAPVAATADEEGRFRLDTLRRDTRYDLYVDAPGFRREILKAVTAGQGPLKVALGPRLAVSGRVLAPEHANTVNGKPYISFRQSFNVTQSYSEGGSEQQVELIVRDGIGYFEYSRLWLGEVTISAGIVSKTIKLKESVKDLTIDLRTPSAIKPQSIKTAAATTATSSTREVIFRFILPPDSPPPTGILRVDYLKPDSANTYTSDWLPLKNGEARLRVPLPAKVGYNKESKVGYWFEEKHEIEVPPGAGPFEVSIPAVAAGAIFGQVLDPAGQPASEIMVSVVEVKKSPERPDGSLGVQGKNSYSSGDMNNKFNLAPLPLGGTYAVVAYHQNNYAVSPPIKLTEKKPIVEVTLTQARGVTLLGRVLDEAGRPLPGMKVQLSYNSPYSSSYGASPVTTDDQGAFAFEQVNPDVPGSYTLQAEGPNYQKKIQDKLTNLEQPVELRMKRGAVLTGRLIDAETGKPLDDAEVYALPQPKGGQDETYPYLGYSDADQKTTARGEFRFSRLEAGRDYTLNCRAGSPVQNQAVHAVAGQTQPVEVRIKLYEWEKKKRDEATL